ncbi:MAG: hypothetical protein FWF46_02040 [Oscillospiraceae bacterium]|nr:hypothetical protein [Oscillospiraceae bacterium]
MRAIKGRRICIICEGYEEVDYITALIGKAIFSNKYEFITVNAKSINTIVSRYQDKYQSNSYDLVLIFCDTDKSPSEKYYELKQKINDFHDVEIADSIVIFGNPCTMQIILSHFSNIKLTSQSKSINAQYIKQHIGIENYSASKEQRNELFSKIKRENYELMKKNISKLATDDSITSSTNFLQFLDKFESDDDNWIDEINNRL